jgi:4-carboxymuconolactone decarboxylase
MNKRNILTLILLFVLTISFTTMNAQINKKIDSALNPHQQNMAAIAALTATGNTEQLKGVLNAGLDAGLAINEIKEAIVQLYAYCGFPRSLNAVNTFKAVLDERKAKGIADKEGKEIVVENNTANKYEQGRKVLEVLTQIPQAKPAPGFGEFAPRADAFLKEHLFADIFNSNVLNYRQREFVTISALAAIPGVEPQLQAHLSMGKNTGITNEQLQTLTGIIEKYAGRSQANVLRKQIGQPQLPLVQPDMMVRIAEIEIVPQYLEEYKTILKENAATSVKLEPGVISIFPMFQKENPNQVRILEIYANQDAYKSHLQSTHFQYYKRETLKMVKSLKLVEMDALDTEMMGKIFMKLKE